MPDEMIQQGGAAGAGIRLACYLGVFAAMALWEVAAPRRPAPAPRRSRWPGNIGLSVVGAVASRLVAPSGAVGFAWFAQSHPFGVLHRVEWNPGVEFTLAVILLDLVIYLQHRLVHAIPLLWRFHRVHHADTHLDVSSGSRFHPVEILFSMGVKLGAILLLGAGPGAVFIFEVLLNATSMFNHSNVVLPAVVDRWLRWLVVTPDVHRIHHSILSRETDSNFGFNLPWWDRIFGTYRATPEMGQEGMTLGLDEFRAAGERRLDRLLSQPFRAPTPPGASEGGVRS